MQGEKTEHSFKYLMEKFCKENQLVLVRKFELKLKDLDVINIPGYFSTYLSLIRQLESAICSPRKV